MQIKISLQHSPRLTVFLQPSPVARASQRQKFQFVFWGNSSLRMAMMMTMAEPGDATTRHKANIRERGRVRAMRKAFHHLATHIPVDDSEVKLSQLDVICRAREFILFLQTRLSEKDLLDKLHTNIYSVLVDSQHSQGESSVAPSVNGEVTNRQPATLTSTSSDEFSRAYLQPADGQDSQALWESFKSSGASSCQPAPMTSTAAFSITDLFSAGNNIPTPELSQLAATSPIEDVADCQAVPTALAHSNISSMGAMSEVLYPQHTGASSSSMLGKDDAFVPSLPSMRNVFRCGSLQSSSGGESEEDSGDDVTPQQESGSHQGTNVSHRQSNKAQVELPPIILPPELIKGFRKSNARRKVNKHRININKRLRQQSRSVREGIDVLREHLPIAASEGHLSTSEVLQRASYYIQFLRENPET